MQRALIVDDEVHAREELAALLREIGDCEIIGACANAVEAIKVINRERPDLLFLDIQMPVLNGFELLALIDREIMPQVVFVTAYDEYVLQALEEKTIDYLLKPVTRERLEKTFDKLFSLRRTMERPRIETPPITRIPCISGHRVKLMDPREVEHVHCDVSGVHVVVAQGEFSTDLTLKVLEERTGLVRCHRQYLINLEHIDEIVLMDHGLAEIRTRKGHRLPVSRRHLKNLKERLGF